MVRRGGGPVGRRRLHAAEEVTLGKIGPNAPCPCGSGKKYKKCCRMADVDKGRSVGSQAVTQAPMRRPPRRGNEIRPGRVSPMRDVPADIPRPEYAVSGEPRGERGYHIIQTSTELEGMKRACRTAREILNGIGERVRPGVTTEELDAWAHEECLRRKVYPSPLNYHGYPKSICTSVNEVICHGIPDSRPLKAGDIVNCDVTVFEGGYHGDTSETYFVGEVDEETRRFVDVTRECLMRGISVARDGARVYDIGRAIENHAVPNGFSVVRAFVGHGIGTMFHMDPQVAHYYSREFSDKLRVGMTFTIEPMINVGVHRHVLWDDDWTAVTEDLQLSAQFEHTILITDQGPEILTLTEGVEQPFLS